MAIELLCLAIPTSTKVLRNLSKLPKLNLHNPKPECQFPTILKAAGTISEPTRTIQVISEIPIATTTRNTSLQLARIAGYIEAR